MAKLRLTFSELSDVIWELNAWMHCYRRQCYDKAHAELVAKALEKARNLLVDAIGGKDQLNPDGRFED